MRGFRIEKVGCNKEYVLFLRVFESKKFHLNWNIYYLRGGEQENSPPKVKFFILTGELVEKFITQLWNKMGNCISNTIFVI